MCNLIYLTDSWKLEASGVKLKLLEETEPHFQGSFSSKQTFEQALGRKLSHLSKNLLV